MSNVLNRLRPLVAAWSLAAISAAGAQDPLPSWNEGAAKTAILDFVRKTTQQSSPDFVAPAERIAVFDNDGTLWAEKPLYVEFLFALDRVKALAPQHPEWATKQPFKAVIDGDLEALAASGKKGLAELLIAAHSGMTTEAFAKTAAAWLATAKEKRFDRLHTALVYQPMLEVLALFRANGFKTFIVSGGTADFMRVFADSAYGVSPEQVVGTTFVTKYAAPAGGAVALTLAPKIQLIDDGPGKPSGIYEFIGVRPVAAFGNSDGDFQMLQWTTESPRPHLGMLVHHTDSIREWKYDRTSSVGKLDKALDAAPAEHWIVIDMKRDWRIIFPFEKK